MSNARSLPSPTDRALRYEPERTEAFRTKFLRYRKVFQGFWWIPALTISIGLVVQAWQAITQPITYQSTARIVVSGTIALPDGRLFNEEAVNFFGTQVELMQSAEVRQRAAKRVQSLRPDLTPVPVSVSVAQIPQTSIFQLTATGSHPEYVRAYLDALMEEYIAVRRGIFSEKSQSTLTAITSELSRLEADLQKSENALLDWQKNNNIVFLKDDGASVGNHLTALNLQLARLETEYNLLSQLSVEQNLDRSAIETVQNLVDPTVRDTPASGVIMQNSGITTRYAEAKQRISLLEAQLQELLMVRGSTHPKVVETQEQIAAQKKLMDLYRQQALEHFQSQRESIKVQIENTKEQIAKWEARALEISAQMGEYETLTSKVARQKSLYDRLLLSVQSVDVNASIQQDIISIMERATQPREQSAPLARDLATGALLGAIVGGAILFLIGVFDDRIMSVSELQSLVEEEVVGIIPHVSEGRQILRLDNEDLPLLVEAFKKLRSWLLFTPRESRPPKNILITSAVPQEGKSVVATNLAVSLASSGAKTLLVDADLRRGITHKLFEMASSPGLGEVLKGELDAEDAITQTDLPNLWLLPRGHYGSHGSEISFAATIDHFLVTVAPDYDYVIFDSSPILAVDETSTISGKMDAVLLVMRSGFTSLRLARKAAAILLSRREIVDGVVYNGVDTTSGDYPAYYYDYNARPEETEVRT